MTYDRAKVEEHIRKAEYEAEVHEMYAEVAQKNAEFLRKTRIPALKDMLEEAE